MTQQPSKLASNNEKAYGEKLDRLRAMVAEGQQTWDLNEKDVAAIKFAVEVLEVISNADEFHDGDIETYDLESDKSPKLLCIGMGEYEFQGRSALDCFVEASKKLMS